jgi:hypothetical protein
MVQTAVPVLSLITKNTESQPSPATVTTPFPDSGDSAATTAKESPPAVTGTVGLLKRGDRIVCQLEGKFETGYVCGSCEVAPEWFNVLMDSKELIFLHLAAKQCGKSWEIIRPPPKKKKYECPICKTQKQHSRNGHSSSPAAAEYDAGCALFRKLSAGGEQSNSSSLGTEARKTVKQAKKQPKKKAKASKIADYESSYCYLGDPTGVRMICLAMHYDHQHATGERTSSQSHADTDNLRLQKILDETNVDAVASFGWPQFPVMINGAPCSFARGHVGGDFRAHFSPVFRQLDPHIVVLDYFWLQKNYYSDRYGNNWLKEKTLELFKHAPSLQTLIMPFDASSVNESLVGGGMQESPGSLWDQWKEHCEDDHITQLYASAGLRLDSLTLDEAEHVHPLVTPTICGDKELRSLRGGQEGRFHSFQAEKWLPARGPAFLCVTRLENDTHTAFLHCLLKQQQLQQQQAESEDVTPATTN